MNVLTYYKPIHNFILKVFKKLGIITPGMEKSGMKQYPGFANTFLNKTCIYEVDPSVFDEQPAPVDFLRVKSNNNIFSGLYM